MQSPLLPDLVKQLAEVVEKEAEARAKFLEELTPEMKAEFILGEVCMHSPARAKHLVATLNLASSLLMHTKATKNGRVFSEKCLVSLTRNDFEPDIVWYSQEKAKAFEPDQMRFPAPDFAVEVLSESTEHVDRGIKFEDYALHGVAEYWIVDTDSHSIEQYLLKNGSYRLHEKLNHGVIRSTIIAGFELPLDDIFSE